MSPPGDPRGHQRRPAVGDERQRESPWSERGRARRERLMAACTTIIAVAPAARKAAKASGARRAARRPRQATTAKQSTSPTAPTKPSSSPTIAKMKSVCGNGRKKSFCRLPPSPLPNQPPAPTAISDWIAWNPLRAGPTRDSGTTGAAPSGSRPRASGSRAAGASPARRRRTSAPERPASHSSTAESMT